MESVPNILSETYGEASSPISESTVLFDDAGYSIQFRLESTDGVAFAMGFESLALSGMALVITPGRAPLGAVLGAALAIAGAEMANSRIIDPALYYTACAELLPCRLLELIANPQSFGDIEDAAEMFQGKLRAFLSGE